MQQVQRLTEFDFSVSLSPNTISLWPKERKYILHIALEFFPNPYYGKKYGSSLKIVWKSNFHTNGNKIKNC
jgi:hypothetical protein